jgi:hypothetical protein
MPGAAVETSLRKPVHKPLRPVNRFAERLFFGAMALVTAAVVVTGFSHSYFAAGMLRAPLPNLLVHVHAAVMTGWMILFLVQTALIPARRVGWHRTLGTFAYCLPILMVPLGTITGLDEMRRERVFDAAGLAQVPAMSSMFFAESLLGILLFGVVVYASWRARRVPAGHKRLVLLATIGIASGGLIRFPWRAMGLAGLGANAAVLALGILLAMVVVYDLFSLGRVHRSTLWAAPLTLVVFWATEPVSKTVLWRSFVTYLARHVAPLV